MRAVRPDPPTTPPWPAGSRPPALRPEANRDPPHEKPPNGARSRNPKIPTEADLLNPASPGPICPPGPRYSPPRVPPPPGPAIAVRRIFAGRHMAVGSPRVLDSVARADVHRPEWGLPRRKLSSPGGARDQSAPLPSRTRHVLIVGSTRSSPFPPSPRTTAAPPPPPSLAARAPEERCAPPTTANGETSRRGSRPLTIAEGPQSARRSAPRRSRHTRFFVDIRAAAALVIGRHGPSGQHHTLPPALVAAFPPDAPRAIEVTGPWNRPSTDPYPGRRKVAAPVDGHSPRPTPDRDRVPVFRKVLASLGGPPPRIFLPAA